MKPYGLPRVSAWIGCDIADLKEIGAPSRLIGLSSANRSAARRRWAKAARRANRLACSEVV